MSDNEYNGWTNYETWCVKLWIDNDQGEQTLWLERAQMVDEYDLAQELRDYHEQAMPELSGMFADLLQAAVSSVNWHEIAASLIDEAAEILGVTP